MTHRLPPPWAPASTPSLAWSRSGGPPNVETLIDLESVGGLLSLSGDLDVARDVAVGIGLALATSRWADQPRVTFVGFADDMSAIAPDTIRHYDELGQVFERLGSGATAPDRCLRSRWL